MQEPVKAELERDGLLELIGEGLVFDDANEALRAYRALPPVAGDDGRQTATDAAPPS